MLWSLPLFLRLLTWMLQFSSDNNRHSQRWDSSEGVNLTPTPATIYFFSLSDAQSVIIGVSRALPSHIMSDSVLSRAHQDSVSGQCLLRQKYVLVYSTWHVCTGVCDAWNGSSTAYSVGSFEWLIHVNQALECLLSSTIAYVLQVNLMTHLLNGTVYFGTYSAPSLRAWLQSNFGLFPSGRASPPTIALRSNDSETKKRKPRPRCHCDFER
jgi:hypothetical protein